MNKQLLPNFFIPVETNENIADLFGVKNLLTDKEIEAVEENLGECKEIRDSDRIKAILSLNEGYEFEVVANRVVAE